MTSLPQLALMNTQKGTFYWYWLKCSYLPRGSVLVNPTTD